MSDFGDSTASIVALSGISLRSRLLESNDKRILYVRLISMILAFLLGLLILAYTLYFFYYFETFKGTTSFFPWAWQIAYNTSRPVIELTVIGIALSVALCSITGAGALLFYRGLQRYSHFHFLENSKVTGVSIGPVSPVHQGGMRTLKTSTIVFVVALSLDLLGTWLAFRSDEKSSLLLVAGVLIIVALFGAAYFVMDSFFRRRK